MSNKKQPNPNADMIWAIVGVVMFLIVVWKAYDVASTPEYKAPANAQEQLTN